MNENIILPRQGKGNLMFVKKNFRLKAYFSEKYKVTGYLS